MEIEEIKKAKDKTTWAKSMVLLLKKIPIDAYVLIVLPLFGIIAMMFFSSNFFSIKSLLFYLFYANRFFPAFFVILYFYFFIKISAPLIYALLSRDLKSGQVFKTFKNTLQNQIYFNTLLVFGNFFLGKLLNQLAYSVSHAKIISSSTMLLEYDYVIFGRDLLFWTSEIINKSNGIWLSWILLMFYLSLPFVIAFFMLSLFLFNKTLARKFILFYFFIIIISLPIWYVVPAFNPINLYIANTLNVSPPDRIGEALGSYTPDPHLSSYQKDISDYSIIYYNEENFLNVTAFPSMHAGYSVGILIYAFLLWRPSLFLALPWFTLEMLGAIHTGQHYAIDLFLGAGIGIIAYFLVELFFLIEKKYYIGKGSLFIVDAMQKDLRDILNFEKYLFASAKSSIKAFNDSRNKTVSQ